MQGMEVAYLLLADHASADALGKINMLGVFGLIRAKGLPYRLNRMYVVSSLVFPPNEAGYKRKITIKLLDEDGKEVLVLGPAEFEVPTSKVPGLGAELPVIMEVNGLTVESEGLYSWKLEIDNDTKQSARLRVVDINKKQEAVDEGN